MLDHSWKEASQPQEGAGVDEQAHHHQESSCDDIDDAEEATDAPRLPGKSLDKECREQERDAQANGVGKKQKHTLPESARIAGQENDGAEHRPDARRPAGAEGGAQSSA